MSKPDFDVYEDMSWTERARYGIFGIALDLADRSGKKNRFMDAVHQTALRRALRAYGHAFRRALDFGCGGGRLLPLLKEFAAEVYGVDRTTACLDLARTQNIIPAERLILWRDGPLPFADGFFDLVLCVYVLLTSEALDTFLDEIARVCARGGLAVLVEQTDNGRGLTLEHYWAAFARAGLRVRDARAVRRSAGSLAMRLATRSWAPTWFARLSAAWELSDMKRRRYHAGTPGYFDYLFVLDRN